MHPVDRPSGAGSCRSLAAPGSAANRGLSLLALALAPTLAGCGDEPLRPSSPDVAGIRPALSGATGAALLTGGDWNGADLTLADGAVLLGTFTNVGAFHIPAGARVSVGGGLPLQVTAQSIAVEGVLDGTGAGFAGGATNGSGGSGNAGTGPGGGGGGPFGDCTHSAGGAGGSYGGIGGAGGQTLATAPRAVGGAMYGAQFPSGVDQGSGGGSASNYCGSGFGGRGGNGGAAITLRAATITISGQIVADGESGGAPTTMGSGGGGGSGGGILLDGSLTLTGAMLSASGGAGGFATLGSGFATGGGGGGGGRISLSGCLASGATTYATFVRGGLAGLGSSGGATPPQNGGLGTVADTPGPCTAQNAAPSITGVTWPSSDPRAVGTADATVSVSATFADPDVNDTHNGAGTLVDWGDGSTTLGTDLGVVTEAGGSGSVRATHTYTTPGVYKLTLTVADDHGGSASSQFEYVVVYDPSSGFATGGGWVNYNEAACPLLCSGAAGRADFGFVSKRLKGATVPSGDTRMEFHAGALRFVSASYERLVINGGRAQYKGRGTINGAGDYGFLLTAVDGAPDRFRIKIWDRLTGSETNTVFDNGVESALDKVGGGGSVVIHSK